MQTNHGAFICKTLSILVPSTSLLIKCWSLRPRHQLSHYPHNYASILSRHLSLDFITVPEPMISRTVISKSQVCFHQFLITTLTQLSTPIDDNWRSTSTSSDGRSSEFYNRETISRVRKSRLPLLSRMLGS